MAGSKTIDSKRNANNDDLGDDILSRSKFYYEDSHGRERNNMQSDTLFLFTEDIIFDLINIEKAEVIIKCFDLKSAPYKFSSYPTPTSDLLVYPHLTYCVKRRYLLGKISYRQNYALQNWSHSTMKKRMKRGILWRKFNKRCWRKGT